MTHLTSAATLLCAVTLAAQTLPLDGTWRFQLDRRNSGVDERWYDRTLAGSILLPGSLPAQGVGDAVTVDTQWTGSIFNRAYFDDAKYAPYRRAGNIKVPFWLQPERYYAGAAWYQRDVDIPPAWRGRRVVLTLERPHWQTRVWLDSREIGSADSLAAPHRYELGTAVAPGRHRLTIRVDNSLVVDIGVNSHSITEHTQGNWNGIVGRIELEAGPPVWLDNVQVYPEVRTRTFRVRGELRNLTGGGARGTVAVAVEGVPPVTQDFDSAAASSPVELAVSLPAGAQLWDEFSPALHRLRVTLEGTARGVAVRDAQVITAGLREISSAGTQLAINGRKMFLRGTLECAVFPKTGHPPVDVASWKKVLSAARAHGLNHLRFHSWCPPEAAFIAADEMGFYYQVETSWPNQSTTLGEGKPVDAWLEQESARILRAYGNHPSFILMSSSNEPGGRRATAWLTEWVKRRRAEDSRRLFTAGSGWPQVAENQYHVTPDPRIQHWNQGLNSRINARPPETVTDYREYIAARSVPVVSHEIGQWCVYPNFDEIPKYTGYLKPRNFEIYRDWLEANHMGAQAHDFLMASGKLQTLCYKEDIESALRTPGMGGFQLLDLHDFPGQGTALVGVLDPFWESKGYVTPSEFSRFTNSTVPLARLARRVFTSGQTLDAEIEVSHFGALPLRSATAVWKLVADDGVVEASGKLAARNVPVDGAVPLGRVSIPLEGVPVPARYKLVVGLEGTPFENDWDVWVYPARVDQEVPAEAAVASDLDAAALARLDARGAVLLLIPPARVKGAVQLGFSSIFWNTAWTNGQAPHTLGILCDPKHPALALFPTDFHSNWQWWYLVTHAAAMVLDALPAEVKPVVQVIDDWFQTRRLGLVLEARVGNGRLLVASIDLEHAADPVGRQMYASLLHYLASPQLQPSARLTADQVRALMRQ